MDLELPVDLKFINTYLQRAKELKERDPVVAYYCQLYCVKLAIQKDIRSPESKQYLISIMNVLEEKKQKLASNEAITNEDIGFSHVENFGLKIFMNADKEDLNQGSTKKTAQTFLAASVFLELLNVFEEEIYDDIIQKIKYAKFKAADIMKALKEGRVPMKGSGADTTPSEPTASEGSSEPSAPPAKSQSNDSLPFPTVPVVAVLPITSPVIPRLEDIEDPEYGIDDYNDEERTKIMQAGKMSKFAISALLYDDVKTAILNLEKALALLKPMRQFE